MVKNKIKISIVTVLLLSFVSLFAYKITNNQSKPGFKKPIIVKTHDWQMIAEPPVKK